MPSGKVVRPKKWSNVLDLYDNGTYSAIWGYYDNSPKRCLGVRWNGNYPLQGKNPLWFVEPDYLAKMILLEFCSRVNKNPRDGNIPNILIALNEC